MVTRKFWTSYRSYEDVILTRMQDIAPNYYDLNEFKKGEMRTALQRVADKMKRREALAAGRK